VERKRSELYFLPFPIEEVTEYVLLTWQTEREGGRKRERERDAEPPGAV
jgi:hypothetical protein